MSPFQGFNNQPKSCLLESFHPFGIYANIRLFTLINGSYQSNKDVTPALPHFRIASADHSRKVGFFPNQNKFHKISETYFSIRMRASTAITMVSLPNKGFRSISIISGAAVTSADSRTIISANFVSSIPFWPRTP